MMQYGWRIIPFGVSWSIPPKNNSIISGGSSLVGKCMNRFLVGVNLEIS